MHRNRALVGENRKVALFSDAEMAEIKNRRNLIYPPRLQRLCVICYRQKFGPLMRSSHARKAAIFCTVLLCPSAELIFPCIHWLGEFQLLAPE